MNKIIKLTHSDSAVLELGHDTCIDEKSKEKSPKMCSIQTNMLAVNNLYQNNNVYQQDLGCSETHQRDYP